MARIRTIKPEFWTSEQVMECSRAPRSTAGDVPMSRRWDATPVPVSEWSTQQDCWSGARALVYLLQEGDDGPVKIGIAGHPARRLSALQGGNHRKLHLRKVYTSSLAAVIERAALDLYDSHRLRGEWMSVSVSEIDAFILGGAQ